MRNEKLRFKEKALGLMRVWAFALLGIVITAGFALSSTTPIGQADSATKAKVDAAYGKLPLYFIQNNGQMDEKVKFYEKGSGHTTFFTKEGVYLLLGSSKQTADNSKKAEAKPEIVASKALSSSPNIPSPLVGDGQGGGEAQFIKLSFLNANPNPEIIAVDQQEGKVNYFTGNDPKKWQTNIPTYKAVLYKEVYPGIDIKFYGNNRQMEYDIVVKPGGDPSRVKFAYEGIEGLEVTENGDLEIILHSTPSTNNPLLEKGVLSIPPPFTGGGQGEGDGKVEQNKIVQEKPVIYQEIEGKRVAVEGCFKILDNTIIESKAKQSYPLSQNTQFAYTFELASYDKTHTLIIDPTLVYATYLGGSSDETGAGIAVDTAGNAYVTGGTASVDFPATQGTYNSGCNVNGNCMDVFVVKLNAAGTNLSYATYLGGGSSDYGHRIAVDAAGNASVAGETRSADFPATPGAFDTTINGVADPNGPADAFVVKLNASGSILVYATYLGGNGYESGAEAMAVDAAGNVYVTGFTRSSDFPVTPGAYDTTINDNGTGDAFVAKLDASGSFLSYATYLGGSSRDIGYGIAVDAAGNAYVTGETESSDFPVTSGAYDTTFNGVYDGFVVKLNPSGSLLSYATYIGGSSDDFGGGIVVDTSGNVYLTGTTRSSDFPTTPGAYDTTFNGGNSDCFVVKLNAAGSLLYYATYIGGSNNDGGTIVVDAAGNVYVGGGTWSSNFPVTPGAYDTTFNGVSDVFVAKLNPSGSLLSYATYLGGSSFDGASGIAMDAAGNVYLTGWTNSSDFPATPGTYDMTYNGGRDVFVVKLNFPIDLPRTGQTTCYDSAGAVIACAGTGQDGEIQAGVPWPNPRFTDNGNATVTDNLTGLMWTQDGNAPGPAACSPATTKAWQEALDYVACLNTNSYLGYSDWRLPNVIELESLANAEQYNLATWLNSQGFNNVSSDYYWSSTSSVAAPVHAWEVGMWGGVVYSNHKPNGHFVWPVRSGQSGLVQLRKTGQTNCYGTGNVIPCSGTGEDGELQAGVAWPNPRFSDNGNNTVTDNLTGLMWTQDANLPGTYKSWQQALDYVNGMNTGTYPNFGYTDWRLPNRKELHSLIDFSQMNPALPSGHPFLNVQWLYYGTSTTYVYNPVSAWYVYVWDGIMYSKGKYSDFYVWPVRGGILDAPLVEICDGIDNDGDGLIDEGVTNTYFADSDGDTYGNVSVTTQACSQPSGYVPDSTDCDDSNVFIHPGASEVCNAVDDNCNGQIDEGVQNTYYPDADSDTFGNGSLPTPACTSPPGHVSDNTDCNDSNPAINPAATEVCGNGVDDNCNTQIDEACTLSADLSITLTDLPDPVVPAGQDITYTITVTNNGPAYATNVTVTDVLDASLTLVSATPSQGAPCTGAGTITCNLGSMVSGSNATVMVVATTSTTPGMIGSTASVSATAPDPNTANNSAVQTTNVGDVSREVGISTRGYVGTLTEVMVGGFSFGGTVSKKVLLRGRGPSMSGAPYNFPGTLTDPILEVYSGQTLIVVMDNWQGGPSLCISPAVCEVVPPPYDPCQPNPDQTTPPPGCMQEAAIYITLPPGAYTTKLKGVNNTVGKGIIEVYDADTTSLTMLNGISTRGKVLTGTDVMVGGFIIGAGSTNKTLLLRGRGPSLSGAPYNFTGTLSDPLLEVYCGPTLFAKVDNWQYGLIQCDSPAISCSIPTPPNDPCQPNSGQTTPPPGCMQEAALIVTLPSQPACGNYTAKLKGANGETGIGIFEVYELSP